MRNRGGRSNTQQRERERERERESDRERERRAAERRGAEGQREIF